MTENRCQKIDAGIQIRTYKDLRIYCLSYDLAMEVFEVTKDFPKEEIYSMVDQIRRSARSIPINIREGFAKRKYENIFIKHLNDGLGSCEETRGWLDFAKDSKYISNETRSKLDKRYDEVSAMLFTLMNTWQDFSDF